MKQKIFSICLLGLICIGLYIYIFTIKSAYNYYVISRQAQYIKAVFSIRCSENTPFFLRKILVKSIYQDSLTNQISYHSGGLIYTCVSGWEDQKEEKPLTVRNNFKYASITKLFTSDLILQLANENKIKLTDPISKYIQITKPILDSRVLRITVLDLLRHSSGFDRSMAEDKIFSSEPWCDHDVGKKLANLKLNYSPSTKMVYSNEGYCLLGKILESIYQKEYNQIINENYGVYQIKNLLSENTNEPFYNDKFSPVDGEYYSNLYIKNLTASANLIGNSENLNLAMQRMIKRKPYNILNIDYMLSCNINELRSCYGLAMSPIVYPRGAVFSRDGVMPSVTTYTIITKHKEILVLLTNSNLYTGFNGSKKFKEYMVSQVYEFNN